MTSSLKFRGTYPVSDLSGEALLKSERDGGFCLLHDQMREHGFEKSRCDLGADDPHPDVTYSDLLGIVHQLISERAKDDGPAESLPELLDDAAMTHGDFDSQDVTDGFTSLRSDDGDAAIGIEEASGIFRRQDSLRSAYDGMVANSVETRCPAREGAEGQYRAKQERGNAPGVCNEHVPPAKAKMCSALHGNMQKSAEMTDSSMTEGYCDYSTRVKDRNIKGDRQCPAGRAYFLRTDDTYFMVDPRFLFEWTGDLNYPDQLAFTRICGLRFFMKTDRRMFEAVVDGVTA